MSKMLLTKLNNIIEIDKEKEYIYLTSQENLIIDLSSFISKVKIREFINDVHAKELVFAISDIFKELELEFKAVFTYDQYNEFCDKHNFIELKLTEENISNNKTLTKKNKKDEVEISEEEKASIIKNKNDEYFLLNKKNIWNKIEEEVLKNAISFQMVADLNKKKFLQTGKWYLKIGFDFLSGNTSQKNKLNAPLFFLDIDFIIEKEVIKIVKIKNKSIFNEKLFLFLNKEEEKTITKFDFENLNFENTKKIIEELISYEIKTINPEYFSEIKDLNLTHEFNTIKYSNVFVISLFDVEIGKLKDDFIEVIKNEKDVFENKMINDNEYYKKSEFSTDALIQINNPLNIYQKYAVRSAMNENTLIYGPPGTGKSEIIANIIANLIVLEKNMLVVSEKDAALDVIFARLNKLNHFSFYLKNIDNKKIFYRQIENISNHMGSFYNVEEESFSLEEHFNSNNRTEDYNKEIKAFRNILKDYIEFIQKRDSNLVDYKEYLEAKNLIISFVDSNKKEIQNFYEEYRNKYVRLQGVVEFIAKIAEFNEFKNKYNLKDKDIKSLEKENDVLINFLIKYDYVKYEIENFEKIENNIKDYNFFLKETLLNKDKTLMELINENYFVLIKNYNIWTEINYKLASIKNSKMIKNFLIKNILRHEKFLQKANKLTDKNKLILLNRYFSKNELLVKKSLFQKLIPEKEALLIIELIKDISEINILKDNKYLLEMEKYSKETFDPITLFFMQNKSLLRKEFIEFYKKKIEYFDERINNQYYRYRVNQIERELIVINNYDFEIKNRNQHIISIDIPQKIKSYLKNNNDFINQMDQAIYTSYLKFLKFKLSQKDAQFQEKIYKMFAISRNERLPKVNEFINEYLDCLLFIFPIWISKPDLVCHYATLEEKIFDVGIFDEASQMFLEKAYPILYRCKYAVVTGDNKQLKPEGQIYESEEEHNRELDLNEINSDNAESLLDRAKISWWNSYFLKNHYRSISKDLISFSNENFYDNELEYASLNRNEIDALDVVEINGIEKNNVNKVEANKVIEILKKVYSDINFKKILIICFTKEQKNEIETKILELKGENEILRRFKNHKIVIKDLSIVQGDEGDLSIISTVYSKNSQSYGLLEKKNGSNYLNVAITRSKKKIIVVKSIVNKELKINVSNKETLILKDWFKFLESHMVSKKNNKAIPLASDHKTSSFKDKIFNQLKQDPRLKSFQIIQNLDLGTHNGDIAFYEKNANDIKLILLLHDWKKNIEIDTFFQEIDKEEYLIQRKYQVLRIMEEKYLLNPTEVLDQISHYLIPEKKENILKNKDLATPKKKISKKKK